MKDHVASAWYVAASGLGFGATFIQTFYLALYFDGEAFGRVVVFLAVFGLCSSLFGAGLDGTALRFSFDDKHFSSLPIVPHVLTLWLILAGGLGVVALAVGWMITGPDGALDIDYGSVFVPAVLAAGGFSLSIVVRQFFVAQRKPQLFALVLVGSRVTVFGVILVLGQRGTLDVAGVAAVHVWVAAGIVVVLAGLLGRSALGRVTGSGLKVLATFAWPLAINALGGAAFSSGYRVVLAALVTLEQIGVFGVASQIAAATYLAGGSITRGYLPTAYEGLAAGDGKRVAIRSYRRVVMLVGVGLGAVVLVGGSLAVAWFKGGVYGEAGLLLPWLVGGQVVLVWKGYAYALATHHGRTGWMTVTSLTGAGITFAATVPMVDAFGLTGAAAAVFLGFCVQVGWLTAVARRFAA